MVNKSILTACALAAVLVSCTSLATAPPVSRPVGDELTFNRTMLQHIYLYADQDIDSLSAYQGHGDPADGAYADVLYMYSKLSDRFTDYYTPYMAQQVLAFFMGSSEGTAMVGIMREDRTDTIVVKRIIPGSPADSAGIRPGDRVVAVNGHDVVGDSIYGYTTYTAGGDGTVVALSLVNGTRQWSVSVTKRPVKTPTVWLDSVSGVPVVSIDEFMEITLDTNGTRKEFIDILGKLGNFTTAVIDLRGNPGGSVDQCMQMSDDILDTGMMIHMIEHSWDSIRQVRHVDTVDWAAEAGGPFEGKRWVFLQDTGSASCSELMLSAIHNNSDWPTVGKTSYGKGIAQVLLTTQAGGIAKITDAEFRQKDWSNYHHIGLHPDYEVSSPDSALALAVRLAKAGAHRPAALARLASEPLDQEAIRRINSRLVEKPMLPGPGGAYRIRK